MDLRHPLHTDERQERFLRMFLPVHDRLARFARAMSNDREEARDLVGDAVLTAYEHFDELQDHQAFLSWIFTIARRLASRKRKRGELFGEYDEHVALNIRDRAISPENSVDLQLLYHAMEQLPAEQREAVAMFEISGLSLAEIQEVQGGSLSGVKSRVARGRQKLAELLGVNDASPPVQHMNGAAQKKSYSTSVRSDHE